MNTEKQIEELNTEIDLLEEENENLLVLTMVNHDNMNADLIKFMEFSKQFVERITSNASNLHEDDKKILRLIIADFEHVLITFISRIHKKYIPSEALTVKSNLVKGNLGRRTIELNKYLEGIERGI